MTQLLLALAAGVLTVAAPCILPMLPILLGATIGEGSQARPFFITLGSVLAFSAVALLFNAFAAALEAPASVLREIAIAVLIVFGVLMIVPHPFRWVAARMHRVVNKADEVGRRTGPGNAGGFVLGATLGVVWTPCAGPVLDPVTLSVTVDGQAQPSVTVAESRMYTLFDSQDYRPHLLRVAIPTSGLQAFTFTFG